MRATQTTSTGSELELLLAVVLVGTRLSEAGGWVDLFSDGAESHSTRTPKMMRSGYTSCDADESAPEEQLCLSAPPDKKCLHREQRPQRPRRVSS
ncbi:unnamed protein product [Heligmosomoides polygyrus]|uniref:Secreted protein n=1 Tax=Heligmosomoides polygyrus TaxID=6339 RepID=A0A183GE28_HELPZ|nr:unnamed protein product [Heligmosomoides polygyrus]